MNSPPLQLLHNRSFDEIAVGDSASLERTVTAADLQLFAVLSGDDEMTLPVMALGGDGIVSVISNATPGPLVQLCERMRSGDLAGARELHFRLLPWMRAAFIESNPLPVKAALAMMRKIENVLRSPLVPLAPEKTAAVRDALAAAGVQA